MSHKLYWGDSHLNLHSRDKERFEDAFQAARGHLDFLPLAYYPMDYYHTDEGLRVESWHNRPNFLKEWECIKQLCRQYHEPGGFVTFVGYEWGGNRTRWGDHNVYYFDEDNLLDDADDIDDLYANLRKTRALAIPHHVGYLTTQRAKDWDHFDPNLSPFVEIFSNHGLSETPINRWPQPNYAMGPWTNGSTVMDALARGLRVGIICSGDSHNAFGGVYGSGLMGVWADELTRESLWEAFLSRRVYGVTGDRMVLDYRVNEACMGSEIQSNGGPVKATIGADCPQEIDRIELIRNNRVFKTWSHQDGLLPSDADPVRCRIRIEPGWGPTVSYGYKAHEKKWVGGLSISEGEISVLQGCWTDFGNSISQESDQSVQFQTLTRGIRNQPSQAFMVEVRAPRSATIRFDADPFDVSFSVEEALGRTQLWADLEGIKAITEEQFGLKYDEIENPDVFFHNAYKLRICQAVTEPEFTAEVDFEDPNPPEGRNWYYARISQMNGQMGWTSPVWVDV
ncbi:MAG: DUF3604 domain-containing protein [Planctomycetota bacterium]|jgi:hypothetical protein|nr:DUF3604 domain-containing protein [Planctomycetota bacterium]MDP6503468.1 DUF3604 domain-containing protein [Planctomycetota bacterium]